jgi:flagellar motor switch protein FliG
LQLTKLTGVQKAAILLIALGSDLSSRVLKLDFHQDDIELLTNEISNMADIPSEVRNAVIEEFIELQRTRDYLSHGGLSYAKEVLEKAVGHQKTAEILNKLNIDMKDKPFSSLRKVDAKQIYNFIYEEHPQTIALILAHLTPEQAAIILGMMPPEQQSEISRRIAILDRYTPDIVRDIESLLERKLSAVVHQEQTAVGGIQFLVDVLNKVGRSTEKVIMDGLEREDMELAEEVYGRLFVFKDLAELPDNLIQLMLKEVDSNDLTLAMRGADQETNARIYKNMSKRAAEMIKEEIEFIGPVRLKEVEKAQRKIAAIIRRLDGNVEIAKFHGGGDVVTA